MSKTVHVSAAEQKHLTPLLAGITTAALVASPLIAPPVAGYSLAAIALLLITSMMSPAAPVGSLTPLAALSEVMNVVFVAANAVASRYVLPSAAVETCVTLAYVAHVPSPRINCLVLLLNFGINPW
jgi:hypothetical protein